MALLVDGDSKLKKALELHEDVLGYVIDLNPHDFERLRNPLMRRLMPPRISLRRIAAMTNTSLPDLLAGIHAAAHIELADGDLDGLGDTVVPESPAAPPDWALPEPAQTIDLLDSDERLDADPMNPIMVSLKAAPPGELLLVKHKWEPAPLYDIWSRTGTDYYAEQRQPDEWWIWIRRNA